MNVPAEVGQDLPLCQAGPGKVIDRGDPGKVAQQDGVIEFPRRIHRILNNGELQWAKAKESKGSAQPQAKGEIRYHNLISPKGEFQFKGVIPFISMDRIRDEEVIWVTRLSHRKNIVISSKIQPK